jgi:putative tricarboxylic transport membrane protein
MDYLAEFGTGFANVFSWPNILIPIAGTLIAMITSFLPGIGGTSVAVVLVVVTAKWDPVSALLLFGALTGGATFMGSITAILFNIPGNVSSTPTLLDGYPMGRNGFPRTAIACAATASAVGSVFGVAVLLALLPVIRPWLLEFGPLEMIGLGILGISTILAVPANAPLKVAAACGLGLVAAMIGSEPARGLPRWTFGSISLYDGFSLIAVLIGFFTLSEIILWRRNDDLRAVAVRRDPSDSVMAGIRAVPKHAGLTVRSSIIGTIVGMVPGVGGTVAGFVAYGLAVQAARHGRQNFGKGDIRGVIAPEAAVDAKDGGSLLPVLCFGLPGSEGGVILLTVLAIHGLTPGLPMLSSEIGMSFTLIVALLLSNLLTSVIGVALTPWLARLTHLRIEKFVVPMLVITFMSLVQLSGDLTDIYVAVGFGLLGYFFRRYEWPRIPFIIAFVLGDLIEKNVGIAGELMRFGRLSPLDRPVALVIAFAIVASLAWMWWTRRNSGETDTGSRTQPPERIGFPAVLAALCATLAVTSAGGGVAYSDYAKTIVFASLLLLLINAALALSRRRTRSFPSEPVVPAAHVMPLATLFAFPLATSLLGLPIAMAGLAVLWLPPIKGRAAWRTLRLLLVFGVTAAGVWAYLDRIANVLLPQPWLLSLLP